MPKRTPKQSKPLKPFGDPTCMYRLAYQNGSERIEFNFLPGESGTAKQIAQDAAERYGKATLLQYDGHGNIWVAHKCEAKNSAGRKVKVVA